MAVRLVTRRTVWVPTRTGWILLLLLLFTPVVAWWFWAESFFAVTDRVPADVLVVEGWIGGKGIEAAYFEFQTGGYKWLVTTGAMTGERWNERRWNYAIEAEEQLLHMGMPRDRLIAAPSLDVDSQRTYEMARSAWRELQRAGIHPKGVNLMSKGVHARRSRLIFEKVFGAEIPFGVIAWKPPRYDEERWWDSSERAEDLIKETAGYPFELILSSGRFLR